MMSDPVARYMTGKIAERAVELSFGSSHGPEPYDERIRLGQIIADARRLLAEPAGYTLAEHPAKELAARAGALEAMVHMLCDSAEIVASGKPEG